MLERWRDDSGQVIVLFALTLIALLSMAAVAIDVGNAYVESRSIQKAADAAALAATQELASPTSRRTGTITTATNSTTVTGQGTAFTTELAVGQQLYKADGTTLIGTIASITNSASLKLSANAAVAQTALGYAADSCADRTTVWCQKAVETAAEGYAGRNLGLSAAYDLGSGPNAACNGTTVTNCFRILGSDNDQVRVSIKKTVPLFFGRLIGYLNWNIEQHAKGVVTTKLVGGFPVAIFARSTDCNSFFIPGNAQVHGAVATNGGVGTISGTSVVDDLSISSAKYASCEHGVPPAGVTNLDVLAAPLPDWPVPFPTLSALKSASPSFNIQNGTNDVTIPATLSATVTQKQQVNATTVTLTAANTFSVGDTVLVALSPSDPSLDGCRVISARTAGTFSFLKSGTAGAAVSVGGTATRRWTSCNPPGVYYIDPGSTSSQIDLDIATTGETFAGYTFVAPCIQVSGGDNSFTGYSGAPGSTVFRAYTSNTGVCPSHADKNAVLQVGKGIEGSDVTGNVYCGPDTSVDQALKNKCWFGGNTNDVHSFTGVMEGWVIEYTIKNGVFNGTGPNIGGTKAFSTASLDE